MADGNEIKGEILEAIKSQKEDNKKHYDEVSEKLKKIGEEQTNHGKVQESTKGELQELAEKSAKMYARLHELEQRAAQPAGNGKRLQEKSAGHMLIDNTEFKEWAEKGIRGAKGISPIVELKNITSVTGSGGPGIWSDRLAGVVQDPLRPVSVRQLLGSGTTSSNLIEWVRELLFTNGAAPAPEGTLKAQSDLTFERVDVPVRTIAHWMKATKQVLADFPQLRSIIDGRLTQGLALVEDAQLLAGDGTGENLLGLVPQATAYAAPFAVTNPNIADTIRLAILQVWQSYYPADGIVLNPQAWAQLQLTKDSQDRYLFGNPGAPNAPMLWGLPVAQSFALGTDEFLVGNFKLAATVFDREQAGVYVSTEDQDNFVKNMVTVLCEERLALAVSRPKAFVNGTFAADGG
ncbi:MAG: phage major capsid protein [Dyella sp.]